MPKHACADFIAQFDASHGGEPGRIGGQVRRALKDSWDITLAGKAEWQDCEKYLNRVMLLALVQYVRKYPAIVIAPFTIGIQGKSGVEELLDSSSLSNLSNDQITSVITKLFCPGAINIQKYVKDTGGYHYWHSEVSPDDSGSRLRRVLLWTIYLNDSFRAGETEFLHQKCLVKPKTGSILLAPAGFTHAHRGNRPIGGNKYIATSWVLFK